MQVSAAPLIVFFCASCFAQEPAVHRIDVERLRPGEPATVTVHGEQLQNARLLWTPFGTLVPAEGHDPAADKSVRFTGGMSADARIGISPARVVTDTGCSAAAYIIVDQIPIAALTAESEAPATAMPVTFPFAVSGHINPVKSRFFTCELQADQTVVIQTVARRLDSDLDAVLTISDTAGNEVAYCDDVPGLEGDATIQFTAPAAGPYRIELRDVKFSGGAKHFFYLRAADAPLPDGPRDAFSESQILAETESNDTRENATAVGPQIHTVRGTFGTEHDIDWYRLTDSPGGPVSMTAHTRDSGSPADVLLRLFGPDGSLLQESDETGSRDAQVAVVVPAGDCLVEVRELGGRDGEHWNYALEIDRTPRIEISLPADRLSVPRGGSNSLPLTVRRLNYDGPLVIQVDHLPPGISCETVTLAAKQSTVPLTLTAAGDAHNQHTEPHGSPVITAKAADETPVTSIALLAPPERKKPEGSFRSARRRDNFFCAAAPAPEFSLAAAERSLSAAPGSTLTIPLSATRHADWSMPIDIALAVPADQLPAGIQVAAGKVEGDAGTLDITIAADAPSTTFTLFLQGTAKKDKQTVTHPVPPIQVHIAPPPAEPEAADSP